MQFQCRAVFCILHRLQKEPIVFNNNCKICQHKLNMLHIIFNSSVWVVMLCFVFVICTSLGVRWSIWWFLCLSHRGYNYCFFCAILVLIPISYMETPKPCCSQCGFMLMIWKVLYDMYFVHSLCAIVLPPQWLWVWLWFLQRTLLWQVRERTVFVVPPGFVCLLEPAGQWSGNT